MRSYHPVTILEIEDYQIFRGHYGLFSVYLSPWTGSSFIQLFEGNAL